VQQRQRLVQEILRSNLWAPYIGGNPNEQVERVDRFVTSLVEYARPEAYSELGALKMFKIPQDSVEAEEALGRLNNEVTVLRQKRPGLVRLLDVNEQEKWIITEYMPNQTLEKRPTTYKGNALGALKAFRSLVETVALLHRDKYVHRDIKPANVFFAENERLALGDFGIVFIPDQRERMTLTNERVGPRDYMPQWGDLGERLESVHTNFDVYMLGKLLWCMVTGRLKLPREYHDRPAYDIKLLFPKDPDMRAVDAIVQKCVVEEPDQCPDSASELFVLVDEQLTMLGQGGQLLTDGVPRPCRVCGKGQYHRMELDTNIAGKPVVNVSLAGKPIELSMFICDVCNHTQFFRAG